MSLEERSADGPLGLIRAHDQASVDQFLAYAESERVRMDAALQAAERRCDEAEAAYESVARENRRIAGELYDAWQEIQAEREHAALTVHERLRAAQRDADERVEAFRAGGPIPIDELEDTVAHMVAPALAAAPTAPPTTPVAPFAAPPGPRVVSFSAPEAAAPGSPAVPSAAAPTVDAPTIPTPTIVAPSVMPAAVPVAAMPAVGAPVAVVAADHRFQEFWAADATPPRPSQREGLITALLPMLALVIVLVVVLAWIG